MPAHSVSIWLVPCNNLVHRVECLVTSKGGLVSQFVDCVCVLLRLSPHLLSQVFDMLLLLLERFSLLVEHLLHGRNRLIGSIGHLLALLLVDKLLSGMLACDYFLSRLILGD